MLQNYNVNGMRFLANSEEEAQQMAAGSFRRQPARKTILVNIEATADLYVRREREANAHRAKPVALADQSVLSPAELYARRAQQVEALRNR